MIIFLWTHPRSVSTAFERIMAERGDMEVIHEPFSSVYYETDKRAKAVNYNTVNNLPKEYPDLKHAILTAADEHEHVFVKDMAYHCFDKVKNDHHWLGDAKHCFLLREPTASIASHFAMNPDVTLEEIGYEKLWNMYQLIHQNHPLVPLVISSENLKSDPEATTQKFCNYCNIPYKPEALEFKKPPPDGWKSWEAWHRSAAESRTIENTTRKYEHTVENTDLLKDYYGHHLPYYQKLKAHLNELPQTTL